MLEEVSPLLHADQIRKPLIVLQGANDPRVLKAESDEIVAAVKKNGVPVEYVVFPDEGHGFTKKKNQIEGYARCCGFSISISKGGLVPNQELLGSTGFYKVLQGSAGFVRVLPGSVEQNCDGRLWSGVAVFATRRRRS